MGAASRFEDSVKGRASDFEDSVKDVGRNIDNEIFQPVKNTVEAIIEDPKKLAAVAIAIAFPGAGAALGAQLGLTGAAAQVVGQTIINTAVNGGDVKAAVISAAIPVVGKEASSLIGETLAKSGITGAVNTVVTDVATRGLTAAALGQDPLAAMTLGGVTAGVTAIAGQIPGFSNLHPSAQSAIRNAVATKIVGGDVGQSLVNSAIDFAKQEVVTYQKRSGALDDLKDAGIDFGDDYSSLNEEQKAVVDAVSRVENKAKTTSFFDKLFGRPTPTGPTRDEVITHYKDILYTDESEAYEMARSILGREPSDFEVMEFIGIPESNTKALLEAIRYDESTFDSGELAQAYKALYGKEPTPEWLASDEAMNILGNSELGRSEAEGKRLLQETYTKDKNTVTKNEAVQFWKAAGFSGDPTSEQLKFLMGGNEATAETYAIRTKDIYETTFNGSGYDSKASAQKAATAAGYNTYTWNGTDYGIPPTAETKAIEERRYALTEGILKQQGTTIGKATDEQLQAALAKVDAVPTSYLKNATIQDVLSGKYSAVDADGTLRVEITGAPVFSNSSATVTKKASDQLPKGMVLASDAEVWGAGGERNKNVEYMFLPDGTTAWVKRDAGTQLPEQFIAAKRLDDLEVNDPEAWLFMASQFDKDAKGNVGDYLVNTANSLMLGAYATGNKDFGDDVRQTLSLVTQAAGQQTADLASAFASQFGLSYDNAFVQAGKALQAWGAANQTASTKKQEEGFFKRISDAKGVVEKIKAIPGAIRDYPGGFTTMILKEGIQEILPLWAARSVAHLGRFAAHSANTAVEVMEVWGNGAGETYADAIKMGYSEQDARVMASKVGLQSAAITAVTNGIGDIALVNRVIGGAVKDSLAGITKAGVKEGITEYFDELGQNAAKQYQLTGKVNWDQATTAATIGMGVGAGTTSGIMLGASINSAAVIGKDSFGRNVSYADFMSGAKQVDMKTLNLNTQVGTAKDGDPITLGSITAMPMSSGISYDMVKSGLPPALTNTNVVIGRDALGNNVTLSSLMSGTKSDSEFASAYSAILNTTPKQRADAQRPVIEQALKDAGLTTYSAADINSLISSDPKGTSAITSAAAAYAGPRVTTTAEATKMLRDAGYTNPTAKEIAQFVGPVAESVSASKIASYVAPRMVTRADAEAFFKNQGYTPSKAEIDQFVRQGEAVVKSNVEAELKKYVDPRQITQAEAQQFFKDFGYTPSKEELASYVRQGANINQEAVKKEIGAYVDPRMVNEQEARAAYAALGLEKPTQADVLKLVGQYNQSDLTGKATANLDSARYNSILSQLDSLSVGASKETLDAIGLVKKDLNSQITALGGDVKKLQSGVDSIASRQTQTQTQIGSLQKSLSDEIQAAKDIGLKGDAALQAGLNSLSSKMGVNQAEVLKQLGTTEAALRTQFASEISGVKTELAQTEKDILAQVAKNEAAGMSRDAALQKAIGDVAAVQKTDAASLLSKLGTTETALKSQIAGLSTTMASQYNSLSAAQKATADALVAQGKTMQEAIAAAKTETAGQIAGVETRLTDAIKAAEAMGLSRDQAITAAVESVAAELGTTKADLLTQLGTTEAALRTEFTTGLAGVSAEVKAAYDSLTADQKALADQLAQQGVDLTTAIQTAQEQTQTQIGDLTADVQVKYDALTAEQKALANQLQQQGVDLTTAIETAKTQTQQQITDLGVEVDARINELMLQGQTYQQATQQAFAEVNAKNQEMAGLIGTQGRTASQQDIDALTQMLSGQREVDLNYDVTGDKQITQADIDFLTQVIGGVKTDWTAPQESPWAATGLYGQIQANELRRQQDLAAAEAQRVADQQAAAERARQESVRGGIRTTALQGQQQLQALQQQLPQAMQMAQTTTTPIYGEMGPYLDLGSPLDFDFFKPSPEKQAATKQTQPTKIAAGGYIDDLLAEGMSVDDLMNLLR